MNMHFNKCGCPNVPPCKGSTSNDSFKVTFDCVPISPLNFDFLCLELEPLLHQAKVCFFQFFPSIIFLGRFVLKLLMEKLWKPAKAGVMTGGLSSCGSNPTWSTPFR
eukprot:TRINITY_DN67548_c6_g1_i2.p2 TRINITY_DN67548_c6_g1~~TRINITY_DN67548_c6_g1_i2.p2  ORF type:complete len:107 (-),score=2.05 TRINITY_DN67548_c6_g1_i2:13-333(-)